MAIRNGQIKPLVNKVNQLSWMALHLRYYLYLNAHILLKGVPLKELLVLKYPFLLKDLPKPPILSTDVTDACDLKCQYCNNPLFPHPRTMMSDEVISNLLRQLDKNKINRIRIGGGEPTLHPRLEFILQELSKRTKFLSIISNGQWADKEIAAGVLASSIDLIEISVDAGGAEVYEHARQNASYSRLLTNLAYLKATRDKQKHKVIIKFRLMLRPSTRALEKQETKFYAQYADCINPQLIAKHPDSNYSEDVYLQNSVAKQTIPVCKVPFKDLQILPDGTVPTCPAKGSALDEKNKLLLGNVCDDSIIDMWNSDLSREIRLAHRIRNEAVLEMCRNCHYG